MSYINPKAVKEAENKGREKFNRYSRQIIGYNNHNFTQSDYDRSDVVVTTNMMTIEIKNRDIPITQYLLNGFMFERLKWDGMCRQFPDYHKEYVNFFQDDYYIVWDLDRLSSSFESRWDRRLCTATTVGGTYGKEKVWKECLDLTINEAIMVFKGDKLLNRKEVDELIEQAKRERKAYFASKQKVS